MAGIAPGQYKLFAWPLDGIGGNAHLNEQFLSKIESRGKVVTVSDNGGLNGVALDLIPRELR